MKKILIYLTLALCLCSLFAVSVFADTFYQVPVESGGYGTATAYIPEGDYTISVNIGGTDIASYDFMIPVLSDEYPHAFSNSFNYQSVSYGIAIDFFASRVDVTLWCNDGDYTLTDVVVSISDVNTPTPTDDTILDGVFSVFSNIGTYIANAFSGLVGLFWTGEQLTFLGILGVVGLCVGIVILFIGLISNFIHFRG